MVPPQLETSVFFTAFILLLIEYINPFGLHMSNVLELIMNSVLANDNRGLFIEAITEIAAVANVDEGDSVTSMKHSTRALFALCGIKPVNSKRKAESGNN